MFPRTLVHLRVASELAVRHLLAGRAKTLIVGGVGALAALLIVVGSAVLGSVDRALQEGITSTVAGDVHVYSSQSKDEFQIMGDAFVDTPDIAPLDDFARVKSALVAVPNVSGVVPLGFGNATLSSTSELDDALAALQTSASVGTADAAFAVRKAKVRRLLQVMQRELGVAGRISDAEADRTAQQALDTAVSAAFWQDFDDNVDAKLQYLESRVAPLSSLADGLALRVAGTDVTALARVFSRFRVVEGQTVPPGIRGFLFSKRVYDDQVKLKVAHGLDVIKLARSERHRRIEDDSELRRVVDENIASVNDIVAQLDDDALALFRGELQRLLGSSVSDVAGLLGSFLRVGEQNFDARYEFFYRVLAPHLKLYRYRVGDVLTLQSTDRHGYTRSVNARLYGVYAFEGLEQAPLAGAISIIDLVTFRELSGLGGADQETELALLRANAGVKDVSRDNAEQALFGHAPPSGTDPVQPSTATPEAQDPLLELRGARTRQAALEQAGYDPASVERGTVLDVAVRLKDRGATAEAVAAIEAAGRAANLPLKAVPGEECSGLLGQFVGVMRAVLLSAVLLVFVVTLVVVSNALLMGMLSRVPEIGALRAIGAQRRLIVTSVLLESALLGLLSAGIGIGLGKLVVVLLGRVGIPAWSDVMTVAFSGQRLFPHGDSAQLWLALVAVVIVSCSCGIYPAWLAMRVSPRRAMSAEE